MVVLGISKDSVASQKKFEEKYGLPFALLSDPEHAVIEAYDVWNLYQYGKCGNESESLAVDVVGQGSELGGVDGHPGLVVDLGAHARLLPVGAMVRRPTARRRGPRRRAPSARCSARAAACSAS